MSYKWKTIENADVKGKTVFVRVDYNVPLDNSRITDATRIERSLPTLDMLLKGGAKLILASHLGRPKGGGKKEPEFSLAPVAKYLAKHFKYDVPLVGDYVEDNGENAKQIIAGSRIIVLENLRYYDGEKKGDDAFAKLLASLADIYVDDAFGTAHRAHASISGIPKYIPGYPGLLMRNEVENLARVLEISNKDRPFMCLLGGAKVADKIPIINNLLERADVIMVGGGMAFTFLKAQGMDTGKSLVNDENIDECKYLMEKAQKNGVDFVLPMDVVAASGISSPKGQNLEVDKIPSDMMGLDIGTDTVDMFINILQNAKTIFWNGPMGVFEEPAFRSGTEMLAKAIAELDSFSVVGGGDSVALINDLGLADKFGHISTGGGASLEFISGVKLPGIEALRE
jgi:phosphoglycerate kinase